MHPEERIGGHPGKPAQEQTPALRSCARPTLRACLFLLTHPQRMPVALAPLSALHRRPALPATVPATTAARAHGAAWCNHTETSPIQKSPLEYPSLAHTHDASYLPTELPATTSPLLPPPACARPAPPAAGSAAVRVAEHTTGWLLSLPLSCAWPPPLPGGACSLRACPPPPGACSPGARPTENTIGRLPSRSPRLRSCQRHGCVGESPCAAVT